MEDKGQQAAAVFDRNALSYQERFMDVSNYSGTLDLFCNTIAAADAPILDLACGPGNISRYVLDKRPGFRLLGLDLAPAMVKLAQTNNPGALFRQMDARFIKTLPGSYAGIIAGFLLPYLSPEETAQLIADAASLLMPAGALYLSTMEGPASRSGWESSSSGDKIYLYYHEAAQLREVLKKQGLKLLHLSRQPYVGRDGRQETDLLMLAVK